MTTTKPITHSATDSNSDQFPSTQPKSAQPRSVSFLGLGAMGHHMAKHLVNTNSKK